MAIIKQIQLGETIYDIKDAYSGFITRDVNNLTNYTLSSNLATVATSGSYNDLSNLPTIPTFNDSRLTINVVTNSTNSTTFRAYGPQAGTQTVSIDLTPYAIIGSMPLANQNDAGCIKINGSYGVSLTSGALSCIDLDYNGYLTKSNGYFISKTTLEAAIKGKKLIGQTAISGSVVGLNDMLVAGSNITLTTHPTTNVITISATDTTYTSAAAAEGGTTLSLVTTGEKYTWNHKSDFSGNYVDLTNKPELFSGSYNDLTDKPTLFSGSYNDLTNKPTIPTLTSQLTNDSNFITTSYLASLSGYDASATQTLKNVNGTLTWVTDTI